MAHDEQRALTELAVRLDQRFPGLGRERIDRDVAEHHARFVDVTIHDFVPVLIERQLVETYRGANGR
ncbi:three-helix bundle dimerization domain-containing protein [Cellulomonas soli]|uniref:three-helix bundle dimerization domain-containing protein n=1 Tax=Cellulomonas soli TaxID=931535 RepID=UPI003F84F711